MPVVVVISVGAGCGSSGFHSATHVYSVHQVETAFAGHGIELQEAETQGPAKVVVLDGEREIVYVAATVPSARPNRLIPDLVNSRGPFSAHQHGNVLVVAHIGGWWNAINGALADLH